MQLFTVDHANRTLPLVRRIVEDIVREHRRWQEAIVELDLLVSAASRADVPDPRAAALEREIQSIATRHRRLPGASSSRSASSSRTAASA